MGLVLDKRKIKYIIMAAMVLFAASPWFKDGIAATDDFRNHIAHFEHLKDSVSRGEWPTFWTYELYSGYPVFHFYSILPYFISIPFLFFFGAVASLKYSIILSFIVAAISMYAAAKMLFKDDDVAFVSAVAYTFFPYHFLNAGIRGAFNELWGYSIFPLALALMIRAIDEPGQKNIILAIISSGAMMLTHIPTAYMLWLCISLYFAYKVFEERKIERKKMISFAAMLVASILLVSFWLLPFQSEMGKANFGSQAGEGGIKIFGVNKYYGGQEISIGEFLSREFGRTAKGASYYLGLSLAALLGASLLYRNRMARFFLMMSVFLILAMMTQLLMGILPLVSVVGFTFRFLVPVGVGLSLVAGASAKAVAGMVNAKKNAKLIAVIAIAAVIAIDLYPGVNSYYWVDQPTENFINHPAAVDALRKISGEEGHFLVFSPLVQGAYMYHGHFEMGHDWEGFREGAIKETHLNYTDTWSRYVASLQKGDGNQTNELSKTLGHYGVRYIALPCIDGLDSIYGVAYTNGAYCIYRNPYERPLVEFSGNGTFRNLEFRQDGDVRFDISLESDSYVLLKVTHFEGHFKAYVNGVRTEIYDAYPKYMQIMVPRGNHKVEFEFVNTPLQKVTKAISVVTLLALATVYFGWHRRFLKRKKK